MACTGSESRILECPSSIGLHQCDHAQDAGIQCFGKDCKITCVVNLSAIYVDTNECMSNNGGCQQICANALPGFTCGCNAGYVLNPDNTTCAGKYKSRDFLHILALELRLSK